MLRNVLKFLGGGGAIILIGLGVIYGIQYWRYINSEEYQAIKYTEDIKRQYAEDTYGGDTPEETLRLFIDALKKGDTDLAARYFILDKQREWKEELAQIKDKGLLDGSIKDLERLRKKYPLGNNDDRFIFEFEARKEPDELTIQADIAKSPGGKWKILDL